MDMNFKALYKRFKHWQQDPFDYKVENPGQHICTNCGSDFVGNFCPVCSQREGMGPITWRSVFRSIGEVWGLNNRSLLYSLVQLFLRPGYFISDYISGKRQVSFPPVKMLALMALLGVLVDFLTGATAGGMFNNDFDFEGDKMLFIDNAFEWMNLHPDVMSVIILSYLIIPNYLIFRFAPRNPRHTLPQGFFIQVFTAVAFLVINIIYDITSLDWSTFIVGNVWLFFTYHQLFGYGYWGTLWRLTTSLACAILLALFMLGVDFRIHMFQAGQSDVVSGFKLFVTLLVRMVTNTDV